MMKLWKYILPLMAVVVFASCSSKDEAEVIPRNKLADIYMEMFMTDQWISDTPGMRMIADTSLVYEPILAKYGYDKLDYIHSVDFYMNDPERFARILRSCMDNLDKRISALQKKQKQMEIEAEAAKKLEMFRQDYSFDEYFPYMADEPYVHYYDSLTFEPDSLRVYRLVPIETADTLYDRLEMIVPADTLCVSDTVAVCDTVLRIEPLERAEKSDSGVSKVEGLKARQPQTRVQRPDLNTSNELWQQSR